MLKFNYQIFFKFYLINASFHINQKCIFNWAYTNKTRLIEYVIASTIIGLIINKFLITNTETVVLILTLSLVLTSISLLVNYGTIREINLRRNLSLAQVSKRKLSYVCWIIHYFRLIFFKGFYSFAAIIYLLSLFSSSFIEEEHQIWYFLEMTQFYLLIFWTMNKWTKLTDLFKCFGLIVASRFLRSINQTGNKWIHLKDIGDQLRE